MLETMMSIQGELARRYRFRSWKDVVLFIVLCILYAIADNLMEKYVPAISEKVRRVILFIIFLIICLVALFAIGD